MALLITAPALFSKGMFSDGLLYAAISRNMANDMGSFWVPHLSDGFFDRFFEHPPLALGLQSIWFRLLGDSFLIERFYSLFTLVLNGWIIVLIWKHFTGSFQRGWLPLFLWIMVSTVTWSCANNMLENTMAVFVSLGFLFYLKYTDKGHWSFILLSGTMLALSALTKGLVGLYIWGVPFFMWLVFKNRSFGKMVLESVFLILSTSLPIVLLYLFSDAAAFNMVSYFNHQVVDASQNVVTVDSRFAILKEFFSQTLIPIILIVLIITPGLIKRKKQTMQALAENKKLFLILMLIVMAGVLPIMISVKQRGFYILTVYPFFSIAAGLLVLPLVEKRLSGLRHAHFKILKWACVALIIASLTLSVVQSNSIGRDKDKLLMCYEVIKLSGKGSRINIAEEFKNESSLHGYFARYGNVSLITLEKERLPYYLVPGSIGHIPGYQRVKIQSGGYSLFHKP